MDGVPEAVVESIVDEIERVLPQVIVNIDVSDSTLKKLEAKERFRMQRAKKEFRHPSATYQRKVDAIKHIRKAVQNFNPIRVSRARPRSPPGLID